MFGMGQSTVYLYLKYCTCPNVFYTTESHRQSLLFSLTFSLPLSFSLPKSLPLALSPSLIFLIASLSICVTSEQTKDKRKERVGLLVLLAYAETHPSVTWQICMDLQYARVRLFTLLWQMFVYSSWPQCGKAYFYLKFSISPLETPTAFPISRDSTLLFLG